MLVTFAADESLVRLNLETQGPPDLDNAVPLCIEHHLGIAPDQMTMSESGVEEEAPEHSCHEDEKEHLRNEAAVEIENESESEDDEDDGDGDSDDEDADEGDYIKDHAIYTAIYSYASSPALNEAELFFGLDVVDEHEPPEEPWMDLPLEAHIRAERRTWPSVLFPVLCIAPEDSIIPLVASSVYHRWVWGIDLPIVAFEISKYGSIVRVHIGWADSSTSSEHMVSRILAR